MENELSVMLFCIFTIALSIGEGSHGHQNGFDEHERCHPRYRQSLDARNRRGGGRTSRPVEGDRAHSNKKKTRIYSSFFKIFLLVFNSIRICSAFEFLLLSRAFFRSSPSSFIISQIHQ